MRSEKEGLPDRGAEVPLLRGINRKSGEPSPPRRVAVVVSQGQSQRLEYFTPALVSEPLRLRRPTRPGQVPDQFASVRIGPLRASSPARTWCEYCQTASATMTGASGWIFEKTSMPC